MKTLPFALCLSVLLSPACYANQKIFLKLPDIDGESQTIPHVDEIEILAISHNVINESSATVGGGSGGAKSKFFDVRLVKFADISSPKLLELVATGENVSEAEITVRNFDDSEGAGGFAFYVITLSDVTVTSLASWVDASSGAVTETISLSFKTYELTYTPQANDCSAGAQVGVCFDVAANKVC